MSAEHPPEAAGAADEVIDVLAPMLGAVRETPNDFSLFSMAVALVGAACLLALGNLVSKRSKN